MSGQNWKNSKLVTSLSQKQYEAYTGKRRWMLRSEVEARFLVCSTCGARTTQLTTNASSNFIGQYLVPICPNCCFLATTGIPFNLRWGKELADSICDGKLADPTLRD